MPSWKSSSSKATRAVQGVETDYQSVNPLTPYFLVFIQADGTVRYNFTAPKQVLEIFRALCQGKTAPMPSCANCLTTKPATGKT
jgi:hypothetical protein